MKESARLRNSAFIYKFSLKKKGNNIQLSSWISSTLPNTATEDHQVHLHILQIYLCVQQRML